MAAPEEPRYRVLVVADDAAFLATVKTALADKVELTVYTTTPAALKALQSSPFHVICADQRCGNETGAAFLKSALPLRNSASCLLVSDASALSRSDWRDLPNTIHVLRKPIDAGKLSVMVLRLAQLCWAERSIHSVDAGSSPPAGGAKPIKPK